MKIWKEKKFMKLKTLFNNLYWKKKYNTLENKFETLLESKETAKDELIKLQKQHISLLKKVSNIDELQKQMNIKFDELKIKRRK